MSVDQKAGLFKNVRKGKWANVIYWTVMYTYVFMCATKYFIYEDGLLSFDFSMTTLYQHIALLGSIIIGFFILRRHRLAIPKRVLTIIALLMIMFGAIFEGARANLIYLIFLSVILGQIADCSLLTYIYEMNNSERLYGIFFCHLLVAAVSIYSIRFNRQTAEFWWLIFALCFVAAVFCFLEKKDTEWEIAIPEEFQKKLYVPLILACIGGVVAVSSSMLVMEKLAPLLPNARYFFYGGAAIGAVVYFLEYRFAPKPATVTLLTGFSTAVVCIFGYVLTTNKAVMFLSASFAGATFNICMMNLYYILCNIIKKYKNSHMLKVAPITSNFAGIVITVISTVMFFYADDSVVKIWLSLCLIGDVIVLATSVFWHKGVAVTAQEEEYMQFDTTITRAQAYEAVGLTEKEIEVADLLAEGLSLREIAKKLFISENTAKTHRSNVYKKMQVASREELVEKLKHTIG